MNYFKEPEHTVKEVVFNQTAGLGDVLFIEPIYRHYHERGYNVVAPVNDDIIWIAEYIPYVNFYKRSHFRYSYETVEQPNDGRLYLPTRFSHPLLRGYDLHYGDDRAHWMPDKYEYLGLPVEMWKTLSFKRNEEKEIELFKHLDLIGKKYVFVNNSFGGSFEKVKINVPEGYDVVEMRKIDGYTMLDWGAVIENAENIYTVETSLVYYIESLKFKGEKHLYPRMPWLPNVEYMRPTLGDSWIYHDEKDLI